MNNKTSFHVFAAAVLAIGVTSATFAGTLAAFSSPGNPPKDAPMSGIGMAHLAGGAETRPA